MKQPREHSAVQGLGGLAWATTRVRLSTLLLLVVIVAEGIALVMQHRESARLRAELVIKEASLEMARDYVHRIINKKMEQSLAGPGADQIRGDK